jgi:hypothetical protein
LGPIEVDFKCPFCERTGPSFHETNCTRPFESSLVLARETSRFKGATVGTPYKLLVKKSGQQKIISKRVRSEKFTDNVEIKYENEYQRQAVIRISRNGTINIISASAADTFLPDLIAKRINDITPFKILTKRYYLFFAQFNLYPEEFHSVLLLNLNILNYNLWKLPLVKKMVNGKTAFILSQESFYYVTNYNYNSGDQTSRSNKLTNPFIQFYLIDPDDPTIKIHVQIYIRGAVQLRASLNDSPESELNYGSIERAYLFLKEMFTQIIVYSSSLDESYHVIEVENKPAKKSKIPNMAPNKSGKTLQPQMCQNRGHVPGGHDLRPVPYSFNGKCPEPGYYVPPRGIKRPDGLVEPCCYKFKASGADSVQRYHNMLLNGYPDEYARLNGENLPVLPDDSAVYIPGTKTREQRSFPGLTSFTKDQLISCISSSGYLRKSDIFSKGVQKSVKFEKINALVSLDPLTKEPFMVTPINNNTIHVNLYFDKSGTGIFVNLFGEIAETKLRIPELAEKVVEGYLFPFPENITFYPFDIKIPGLPFYGTGKNRISLLNEVVNVLKENGLNVRMDFGLNVVKDSEYYLNNFPEISGLLFISYKGNKYMWSDTLHDSNILIDFDITNVGGNKWKITSEGQALPDDLFKRGNNEVVELPVSFTKKSGDSKVLFQINLRQTDFKIVEQNPFIPLEVITEPIYSRQEIIHILESIKNPISRTVFTNVVNGNTINGYTFEEIGKPLKKK